MDLSKILAFIVYLVDKKRVLVFVVFEGRKAVENTVFFKVNYRKTNTVYLLHKCYIS